MEPVTLTVQMIAVLGLLGLTVVLFAFELLRVDLAALVIMVLLGSMSYVPMFEGLVDVRQLFAGFSSNAVMSIIAVMIIGAGLDKTGVMSRVAALILRHGGGTEQRIVPIVSSTVGVISSFMQNVGAAALFLPVVSRISARTRIPLGRLLMPMGFCAILGGTLTMVGSSPLILLNDLIAGANSTLPADAQMAEFSLFSVTPIGLALVVTGIIYFVLFGRWVLPKTAEKTDGAAGQSMKQYLKRLYGLQADIFELDVPTGCSLQDCLIGDVMLENRLYIIGTYHKGRRWIGPPVDVPITAPCRLAVLGQRQVVERMAERFDLKVMPRLDVFTEEFVPTRAGVAEIVVPPDSQSIGQTARDLKMRRSLGLSLLAVHRGENTYSHVESDEHEATDIGMMPLQSGDTLVVHTQWERLTQLKSDNNFVIVTSDFPQDELRPKKVGWALLFFLVALSLILLTDVRLSLALLIGATGMIIARVLTVDEAYAAVSWNTVFLLASLIPLGQAVQQTGTASWIAQQVLTALDGWPMWSLQAGVAILATAFTLVMSNVGATVLLVPLAVSIAITAGGDPALFAMTVAISTSNSFIIPTHQVNALLMGPGGYRVVDFVRCGGIMTLLFLVVSLTVMNLLYT